MEISKNVKDCLELMVIKDIKHRMKYATFMKKKYKKGTPEFEFWNGKRVGLRKALISLQITIKDFKII
jgi:hypothetical protein